jgi:predicted patatin/cPLA2 family phospholipase
MSFKIKATGLLVLLSSLLTVSYCEKQDRCLGLVLRGGANRGAYEVGVLDAFIKNLPPQEV